MSDFIDEPLSRREFMRRTAVLGSSALLAGSGLATAGGAWAEAKPKAKSPK